MNDDLETIAKQLEHSDDYRVLRRLSVGSNFAPHRSEVQYLAIYLDLETTGLNPDIDEIIEVGMVPFSYGSEGQIFSVGEVFSKLREPSIPLSPEITKITGITNDMVRGKTISPDEIFHFANKAGLIIAHNAKFDRAFLEKFAPQFSEKPWACSMTGVPWKEEGVDGVRLSHIAAEFGFFYGAHRAVEDCLAGVEVLSRNLPISGELALMSLLTSARKTTQRIWAIGAPYEFKDVLKARGYRWNDGSDGNEARYKAWYCDIDLDNYDKEISFLQTEIYHRKVSLPVTKITATDRFSARV